jgi:lysophospholipase L1-like esterase
MILFVGCSFTWGSGLQYEYLLEKGWSLDKLTNDLNRIITKDSIDPLDYKADEYRKNHGWPNLVAKKLNKPYVVGTYCNSASNLNQILESIRHTKELAIASKSNQIDTVVVQFTDWTRDGYEIDGRPLADNSITKTIESQIKQIADECDAIRNSEFISNHSYSNSYPAWVGLSWRGDIGNILKEKYSENFIPIHHNNKEYTSFSQIDKGYRLCDTIEGLDDTHLNSQGCKIISDSIIRKLKQYESTTD